MAVKNIIEGNEVKNKEALANPETLNQFKNISEYEGNKLEINPSQIKVNDIHVEQYTFKKDMGFMTSYY